MSVKFELKGLKQLNRALQQLPRETENKVLQQATDAAMKEALPALQHAAPKHETGAQSEASKEYGSILSNLAVEKQKNVRRGAKGTVITTGNAFWAWFYEFGSRHQPTRPWFLPAFRAKTAGIFAKLSTSLGAGIETAFQRLIR